MDERQFDDILRRLLALIDDKYKIITKTEKILILGDYVIAIDIEGNLRVYEKIMEVIA